MNGVQTFLGDLGLCQYYDMFVIKGFDSENDLVYLDTKDLDAMYITDLDHRKQILDAVADFQVSDQFKVFEWLKQNGLDHYYPSFIEGDYSSLEDIERLNLPNEDVYDELEITLPGHKRRLERAVNLLRKRHRPVLTQKTEIPVAIGRWGKPECLVDAKFDFLVLDATIMSTNNPAKFQSLEFMIDSGSDVVTVREEILQTLDLELLGTIHSKGVHGSKRTNLYKATLRIGSQEMEIEVMGETYDSLGSRVVRHFRHYIDGSRHVWLKGNYRESDTNIREATSFLKALPPPPVSVETVNLLRKRHRPVLPQKTEIPVAIGRWGKPECLVDAKFDFLVLDATIMSTNNPAKFHSLEFMIDSGSDVVTVREEILQTLDLELLGTIHSKGVHGSKRTNLYKATLRIGSQEMEIEVMGETYDSLGSRVVRHFRHYIDGSRHVWLKGNYRESDTNIREVTSFLKALPPPPVSVETGDADTNSFLPISKAPVTNSSPECLKPKPIPAKPMSNNCDLVNSTDSKVSILTKQDTIELPQGAS